MTELSKKPGKGWRLGQRLPIEERYWAMVDVRGPDECWPWTGNMLKFPGHPELLGYGLFWDGTKTAGGNQRMVAAHRWGYKRRVGPIRRGLLVCHACDFRPCQNDRHWWLGTHADNAKDAVAKGRKWNPAGELHNMSRHTQAEIDAARVRFRAGGISQAQLARDLEMSESQMSKIIRGVSWR